jgi:DNA primase
MTEWVDFRHVKEQVRLVEVIRRYGVALESSGPGCLRGRCPLPTHASRDSVLSFSIDTGRNIWACHSQSCIAKRGGSIGGNVLDFVAVMERCTIRESALLLQRWFLTSSPGSPPVIEERSQPISGNRPLKFQLSGIDPSHPYIGKRGIGLSTARLFGIGYYSGRGMLSHRVVIPIHNRSGDLIAYAGRSVDGREPKYRLPRGFRKAVELFNFHRVTSKAERRQVFLVEGFFDCMKVHQAGYPNVVALMGCSLSDRQSHLLRQHFDEVILVLDGDSAGSRASDEIAARLSGVMKISHCQIPSGRQPDELPADELRGIIGRAIG